ncbi:MAG: hypothetical protein AAGE13_12790 [Pseudomonadota bacterium]
MSSVAHTLDVPQNPTQPDAEAAYAPGILAAMARPFEVLVWLPFLAGMVEFVLSGQMPVLFMAVTAMVAFLGECIGTRQTAADSAGPS